MSEKNRVLDRKAIVILLAPIALLMASFFVWPLVLIIWTSVSSGGRWDFHGYEALVSSGLIGRVALTTVEISVVATTISLLLGFPIALHLWRQPPRWRAFYMILVMLPFWTSILVKSFALTVILGNQGIVNRVLRFVSNDMISFDMMFNRIGLIVGMVNYLLPFMVLPILASLLTQDRNLHRAAEIMGSGPARIFITITLPLSLHGVVAGILMNLAICVGMYITPALLGGRRDLMLANLVDFYTRQTLDWQTAAAIAVVLLASTGVISALLLRVRGTHQPL